MDDLKPILEKAAVPDPGPAYWQAFPDRVIRALDAPAAVAAEPRHRAFPGLPAAAAAAALLMLAALLTVLDRREPAVRREAAPAPAVLRESKRTARLASESQPEGVLKILEKAAREKVEGARSAGESGNWSTVAVLARAYEKIVRVGLLPGVHKALDAEEDLEPCVPSLREAMVLGAERWRALADQADDLASQKALESALEVSDSFLGLLDDRFGRQRG